MTSANIDNMTIGLAELCRICSMTQRMARDYSRAGVFVQRPKGRYPLIRCVSAYIEKLRASASGRDAAKDPSRTAPATAQAAVAMAKAGVLSGKLVDVKEMEADALAEWRKLRGLILAIPTRVANQAIGLDLATLTVIESEVRDTLNEMADATYTSPVPFEKEVEGSPPPSAKATAKRVDRGKHKAPVRSKRASRSR